MYGNFDFLSPYKTYGWLVLVPGCEKEGCGRDFTQGQGQGRTHRLGELSVSSFLRPPTL